MQTRRFVLERYLSVSSSWARERWPWHGAEWEDEGRPPVENERMLELDKQSKKYRIAKPISCLILATVNFDPKNKDCIVILSDVSLTFSTLFSLREIAPTKTPATSRMGKKN